ncbi:YciI family protein [Mycobacterium sp. pW049]|uniref:YciI family protein n=1 Tax=[Mycobacterium] bulgaricum TaxID=3238985 RepID=UPI00351B1E0F
MHYLALLYWREDPATADPQSPEFAADVARYAAFDEKAGAAVVGGGALHPSSDAISVRPGPAAPLVTDGPFTEQAEVIGGIMVLDCQNLDDALEVAAQIPAASDDGGAVELWPMVEFHQHEGAQADWWAALLYEPQDAALEPSSTEWQAGVAEHARFGATHGDSLRGGGALYPPQTATTVRVRDARMLITDGPFSETAEIVNGLYFIAAPNRDDAVAVAAQIPIGPKGGVEVRQVVDMTQ